MLQQAWKPLPAGVQGRASSSAAGPSESEEQPPNPFQQAAGGIDPSRHLSRTREVLSMPSSRSSAFPLRTVPLQPHSGKVKAAVSSNQGSRF